MLMNFSKEYGIPNLHSECVSFIDEEIDKSQLSYPSKQTLELLAVASAHDLGKQAKLLTEKAANLWISEIKLFHSKINATVLLEVYKTKLESKTRSQ